MLWPPRPGAVCAGGRAHTCVYVRVHTLLCVCACWCVHAHTCVGVCVRACLPACMCVHVPTGTCVRTFMCLHTGSHACTRTYVHTCVQACVGVYTCLWARVYVCHECAHMNFVCVLCLHVCVSARVPACVCTHVCVCVCILPWGWAPGTNRPVRTTCAFPLGQLSAPSTFPIGSCSPRECLQHPRVCKAVVCSHVCTCSGPPSFPPLPVPLRGTVPAGPRGNTNGQTNSPAFCPGRGPQG